MRILPASAPAALGQHEQRAGLFLSFISYLVAMLCPGSRVDTEPEESRLE